MPLEHRLQILLDDERHRRLVTLADERGVSVAAVVREAIDRGLADPAAERCRAGARILAAEPIEVGTPAQLRAELDELHSRHG